MKSKKVSENGTVTPTENNMAIPSDNDVVNDHATNDIPIVVPDVRRSSRANAGRAPNRLITEM